METGLVIVSLANVLALYDLADLNPIRDDLDVIAEAREDIQDISYFLISSSFYVYMTIAYLSI